MITIICLVAGLAANASQAVGRGQAFRDIIWSHLTGRVPKFESLNMQLSADGASVVINGLTIPLRTPGPALANLPGVRLLGLTEDRSRPWMLFVTRDTSPTLIWAYYDRPVRRLKFGGCDRAVCDPKAFLMTRAYLEAALDEVPADEFLPKRSPN